MREGRDPLNETIAHLGRGHADVELSEPAAATDPVEQFRAWMSAALAAELILPNAMVLATADARGRPSARMVLLKGVDDEGFTFFTNYASRKGRELEENPHAALVFHWAELERQVRITGRVARISPRESDAYWRSRPRTSQLGAWASRQSEVIAGRAALDRSLSQAAERFRDAEVPRPPTWGGYVLDPEEIEFWQGRLNRLHDRLLYRRHSGAWTLVRLAP